MTSALPTLAARNNPKLGIGMVVVGRFPDKRRVDYARVESTGLPEPPPAAEVRLGRRTAFTVPLLASPRKN